jgi:hypothetical protein
MRVCVSMCVCPRVCIYVYNVMNVCVCEHRVNVLYMGGDAVYLQFE